MEQVLCPLSENARSAPHRIALISDARTWSYLELDNAVLSLCHFLEKLGIKERIRVAFIAQTHPSAIVLFFALFRLGAIACPLSFRIPQEQISKYLDYLKISHFLELKTLPFNTSTASPTYSTIQLNTPATLLFTSGSSGAPRAACHSFGTHN
jgi:O-succinylbenzoic acid--CoA ligase